MALISEKDQQTLRAIFAQDLQNDVTITYFTQGASPLAVPSLECEYCVETRQLLEELTACSDKLHLTIKDFVGDAQAAQEMGIERIPAFVLEGQAKGKVRFFGIPSGYEFSTLIEDLLDVARGSTDLNEKTRLAIKDVKQDVHIQVFVTPT